jgi:ribonuclease HI
MKPLAENRRICYLESGMTIKIYTDGSCHAQLNIGAWAAIIFVDDAPQSIWGTAEKTTHQRMEIQAIIEALKFVIEHDLDSKEICVFTDSQYAMNLPTRQAKLVSQNYLTKAGRPIANVDLVQNFFEVIAKLSVKWVKVKAHQKAPISGENWNRVVDKLVRKTMREFVMQQHGDKIK